ncbi:MAG: hypothetical protein LBC44_00575 [Mycoplasmataceae bacterium]|jgi:hypothetical protein|nr:hypothetical protein [Mycoplasmataceae bacterium]
MQENRIILNLCWNGSEDGNQNGSNGNTFSAPSITETLVTIGISIILLAVFIAGVIIVHKKRNAKVGLRK